MCAGHGMGWREGSGIADTGGTVDDVDVSTYRRTDVSRYDIKGVMKDIRSRGARSDRGGGRKEGGGKDGERWMRKTNLGIWLAGILRIFRFKHTAHRGLAPSVLLAHCDGVRATVCH